MGKPTIYLARTEDRTSFVNLILEKVRNDFIQSEPLKVLVKPNIVSREPYPTTTHPQVLASVLDFLLHCKCRIVVADGPAFDAGDSEKILSGHPLAEVCRQRGLELQNLHRHGFKKVKTASMSLELSSLAFECDYIISLPVLKPHGICRISGALKNQFGLLRNRERLLMHTRLKSLSRGIAETNSVVKPGLFIMDAVRTYQHAQERRHGGREATLGYMLAGRDPVALDALGFELLKSVETGWRGQSPESIPYLRHAFKLGLGSMEYEVEQVALA
jgi:uncharacterized protein (DUF362 family)